MKKIISAFWGLFLIISCLSAQQSDPTLMKINGKNIPLSEFEYIYNKNNSNNNLDKKTLDEYVDLFVNFKLKVEEAIAQGMDTTEAFTSELGQYRSQLAEPYLTDNKANEALLKEAYDRKKNEVEVRHILIKIPEKGTAADTLQAYNKALNILKRASKEDFEKLARETSEDPSVEKNGGYVGWISALRTPYAFENMAYNTPVGTVSKPVRTFLGYHLIKVLNKRESLGDIHVAHIALLNNPNDTKNNAAVKSKIDSLYQRILAGDDFGKLATQYSQDQGSARQNGELPWFGSGQMVPEFENAAYALQKPGDFSKPILSPYGWHIIKLMEKKPIGNPDDLKAELEGRIKQDERLLKTGDTFSASLKKEYNFMEDNSALKAYYALVDKFAPNDSLFAVEAKKMNKPLFSFADKQITQQDFSSFLISSAATYRGLRCDFIDSSYKTFVSNQLKDYEHSQLDKKYPEYRNLMQEYHDGILLFEVSNKEVWDKASRDTEGLSKYFDKNRSEYAWQKPHYKGRVIYCKNKQTLKSAKSIVNKANNDSIDKYLRERLNDSIQYVKIEKGLWTEGENKAVDALAFKKGKYEPTKDYPYSFVTGKILATGPETYTDVRGVVTADYQDYLEKEWITALRKKYPVEIDENVLKTVKKN